MTPRRGAACLLSVLLGALGAAQSTFALDEMTVSATRVERSALTLPFSVSTVEADDVQRRQMLGLDEALLRVPGMYFSGRYNSAQDLRISIRGFGARANFGIRGIKIYVDGLPSTVADGQTSLDDLDLSNVERVEVLRGPAAALYGASAGGVINIRTQSGPVTPFVEAGTVLGQYGQDRVMLKGGGQAGALNYFVNGSYLDYDGYRDHSETRQGIVNTKLAYTFADGSVGQLIMRGANAPTANDPGGLSSTDLEDLGRRGARQRNIDLHAGETVQEQKVGLSWHKNMGVHEFTVRNYYNWRDFDGTLPVTDGGAVTFRRFFYGGGGQYSNSTALFGHANRVTVGFEVETMTDDRKRYTNLGGVRGALGFDQDENADTTGVFMQEQFAVTQALSLEAGLRYDHIAFDIDDRFVTNGDQSNKLSFNEVNPMIGAVYSFSREVNFYVNYATAFETPTFTEFARPADVNALGGFANVAPQRTRGYEVGFKGVVLERVNYQLAFFDMQIEDEVTTVENRNGRAFFNNANTARRGLEAGLSADLMPGLRFSTAYTFSDFSFDRFAKFPNVENNELPGVPTHNFYAEFAYQRSDGWFAKWDINHVSGLYADNANSVAVPSYTVSNLVFGRDIRVGNTLVTPSFGVNNLFDEQYNQSIRIQESNQRYFEPAPDLNVFGALRVRFDFAG